MPNSIEHSALGKNTSYSSAYDASLLYPIERAAQRSELGLNLDRLPFFGADLWTAFEVSWLNLRGKPQVAVAHFTVPSETRNIIESKSFKLYLNSFNNTSFDHADAVRQRLREDLTQAAWRGAEKQGTSIGVRLVEASVLDTEAIAELDGLDLDRLDLDCSIYEPAPDLLTAATNEAHVTETLCSRLLKSNCPVTGQPDWGSLQISYTGPAIDQAGLLRYIISYRNHNGFHEHCVERIFTDIWQRCKPTQLTVYARYTRRGGLDINPYRSSSPGRMPPPNIRTARQ